jgi:hypothetical protein
VAVAGGTACSVATQCACARVAAQPREVRVRARGRSGVRASHAGRAAVRLLCSARGGKVGRGICVKEGGGRRLARRGVARGRACGSQAGGRRGKEERKGRKKRERKRKEGKEKKWEREKERARKRKGKGITSALIAERRLRVVNRPPSGAGWDSGQVRCRSSGWRGKTERVKARVLTGFDDEQFLNETL